jgi:hypothetical protein
MARQQPNQPEPQPIGFDIIEDAYSYTIRFYRQSVRDDLPAGVHATAARLGFSQPPSLTLGNFAAYNFNALDPVKRSIACAGWRAFLVAVIGCRELDAVA